MEKTLRIIYLPIALSDLQQIVDYVAFELKSPQAAENFLSKLDDVISRLENFPLSGKIYIGNKKLEHDYRILVVESHLIFYTVLGNTLEIHRVLYGRRNLDELV